MNKINVDCQSPGRKLIKDLLNPENESVSVTRLWAERSRNWGSIPGRNKIVLFFSMSGPALVPIQPPIQWV
jgi:hypothetical protein